MQSTLSKIVTTLEQIDTNQQVAARGAITGRFSAALIWFLANLVPLVIVFAVAPAVSALALLAAFQAFFAVLVLPALIFDRYAGFAPGVKIFKWQEFILWAAIAGVFVAAAAMMESSTLYQGLIAAGSGLFFVIPGAVLARSVKNYARASRRARNDFQQDFVSVGPLGFSVFAALLGPVGIIVASWLGNGLLIKLTGNLFPPTLAYSLAKAGLSMPDVYQMASLGLWIVLLPIIVKIIVRK